MSELTFKELRKANIDRLKSSKYRKCEEAWTTAHWVQALLGELGELANVLKKIDRGDFVGMAAEDVFKMDSDIRHELADIQTYLDILAFKLGVDLAEATVEKFNIVSSRIGSKVRL